MSKNRSRLHIATELSDSQKDLRQAAPDEHIASEPVTQDQIATLAYEYWEQRGGIDGHDEEDWFRAEAGLTRRQPSTAAMKALSGAA